MELFVDSDPDTCAEALAKGVPTVLFSSPKYLPASKVIRPWTSLYEEQERQKRVVAEKYAAYINNDGKRWE